MRQVAPALHPPVPPFAPLVPRSVTGIPYHGSEIRFPDMDSDEEWSEKQSALKFGSLPV